MILINILINDKGGGQIELVAKSTEFSEPSNPEKALVGCIKEAIKIAVNRMHEIAGMETKPACIVEDIGATVRKGLEDFEKGKHGDKN